MSQFERRILLEMFINIFRNSANVQSAAIFWKLICQKNQNVHQFIIFGVMNQRLLPSQSFSRQALSEGYSARSGAATSSALFPGLAGSDSGRLKIWIISKFCKFLAGSFSAVSKRDFARKYAFDSIFNLYKSCILFFFKKNRARGWRLLHCCNLKTLAKKRFEKSAIIVKSQKKVCKCLQMFANFANFQTFQLDNLVDFAKCCKTRI